jgi:phage-related minor tail protein
LALEKQYYEEAIKGSEELNTQLEKNRVASRSFEYGWKSAFEEYVNDATNAAKYAQSIFQKATTGMEDLIVNFAKTGKFEFKSFMNSILEDLLRSQVRQLMAQVFNIGGSTGGAGGFFGGIGKLLGFANGGIIPTNNPVLVGERGPELISGAAGRNVTPNSALGGGNYVTYNINAVDALSFKQLVASDPAFLYAVTQQGAKSVPQTRR